MKSYLKKSVFASVVFLVIFVTFGCNKKITEPVVEPKYSPKPIVVEEKKLVEWKQDIDKNISTNDPVLFYNEYEIIVVGTIPITSKEYVDGKVVYTDSSVVFDYSVPALTAGKIIEIDKGESGGPINFKVRFTKKDTKNYDHIFKIEPDSTFILEPMMKIYYKGKEYDHEAGITGEGDGYCKMLFDPKDLNKRQKEGEPAEGVSVKGTKKIK